MYPLEEPDSFTWEASFSSLLSRGLRKVTLIWPVLDSLSWRTVCQSFLSMENVVGCVGFSKGKLTSLSTENVVG